MSRKKLANSKWNRPNGPTENSISSKQLLRTKVPFAAPALWGSKPGPIGKLFKQLREKTLWPPRSMHPFSFLESPRMLTQPLRCSIKAKPAKLAGILFWNPCQKGRPELKTGYGRPEADFLMLTKS